jgi:hypothetical protein
MVKYNTNHPTISPNGHTPRPEKLTNTLKPYQQATAKGTAKTHNPDTSYQPNHSAPDTTGQNSNTTAKPPADYVGAPHTPRQQRQTSSSENEAQEIRQTNRKKTQYTPANTLDTTPETQNRYDLLSQEKQQEEMEVNPQPHPNHKPPPIFTHVVINYDEMSKHIREITEDEQYHTKSLANDVIKLNCMTPETYRKIIKHFKENNTY